jgi:putative peptidoglycan lipid II flippase
MLVTEGDRRHGMGRIVFGASLGTLGARILGFVRNLALTAAIGTGLVADAFNVADNLPNMIFLLVGGGTIAAVFVPQLVRHASVSDRKVEEYGSVLILIAIVAGALVTIASIALGPVLIGLLGGSSWSDAQSSVSLAFLVWCAPQMLFLAVYWVIAQILNARGKFASVNWLPATSSVVVIVGCVAVLVLGGIPADDLSAVDESTILLLGGMTTLGAAVQTLALLLILLRMGFRFRLPATLRGLGLRVTARTGVWIAASTAVYQLASLVAVAATTQAGSDAQATGTPGHGYTAYFYALTLVNVVSAIAVASLVTVLLQRLSKHQDAGDMVAANSDLDTAVLRMASITIPVTGIFLCLGPVIAEVLFTRGSTDADAARVIGIALALSGLSLFPNAVHKIMLRPFYARQEGFRPFISAVTVGAVSSALVLVSVFVLPPESVLYGAAAAYAVGFMVEMPIKAARLRRMGFRLARGTVLTVVRIAVPALIVALLIGATYLVLAEPLADSAPLAWAFAVGGGLAYLGLYHLMTRRSAASLTGLVRWLRR